MALGFALAAFALLEPVRAQPVVLLSLAGAGGLLVAWAAALYTIARRDDTALTFEVVLRKPHYVQMCAQGSVLLWWGFYVRSVYAFAPLILAQVIFAFGVDSLLSWTRYRNYRLGVGPVPVIFSINLFLWFELEWFYLQLAMVALVFFGKEFLRWTRDGRSTHIFNPSSFALAVVSLLLILTGTTDITTGVAIASTQNIPPYIYAAIFLAALPGQLLFGVATMTMSAAITMYAFGLAYLAMTGTYFFYDAYIPIAVFLGMHLLFTDPATSPRSELGRVIFGVLYTMGILVSVLILEAIGEPTFYDKLLPVPVLNLLARRIDRVAEAAAAMISETGRLARTLAMARHRYATAGLWIIAVLAMSGAQGVGDSHPGQYMPFWDEQCEAGSDRSCDYLAVMQQNYCDRGSGWACNEFGILRLELDSDPRGARGEFQRACDLGFARGCTNASLLDQGGSAVTRTRPPLQELPILLRGSKGPVTEVDPEALYAMACEQGWEGACSWNPGA